ncbi:response regulator transcription factor [Janthinobacterium sp. 17J80-10]|uniref:response regulator transcription factor n=1 Tax=Janthinobacterium sp. 17J80-10 TaxID=2497863 RepID=UPI001005325E|nr:response regulator transcription factor [Janthinobacterium sp. 17J80-10]QAU33132.1 response regulator transcription factor [Janthinobacterium sp. 17J80-10]
MHILIVEDDATIADNLYEFLAARGYGVDAAPNGLTAMHLLATQQFDAVVLDIGLPGMDGLTLAQRLRRDAQSAVPILMLTARDTLDDKLAGFDAGADDYLVKPFALKEVEARLLALVRRAQGHTVEKLQRVGELAYDPFSGIATWRGEALKLPPKTLKLLQALLARPGRLFSRDELEQAVWGQLQANSDTLRSHLSQLRRELTLEDGKSMIETVHGRGYRLVEPHEK